MRVNKLLTEYDKHRESREEFRDRSTKESRVRNGSHMKEEEERRIGVVFAESLLAR